MSEIITTEQLRAFLCQCKKERVVHNVGFWDGCAIEGGGHTAFEVNICSLCAGISGLPSANLERAITHGTVSTKTRLLAVFTNHVRPFRVGDYVEKSGGDYTFEGWILSIFQKRSGVWRCNVEDLRGVVHIFNLKQLAKKDAPQ